MCVTVEAGGDHNDVTLHLVTIDDLFAAPEPDPFRAVGPIVGSGLDYLLNALTAVSVRRSVRLAIVLHGDAPEPDLTERTRDALRRYCDDRLRWKSNAIRAGRAAAIAGLWRVSLVALAVTIAVAYVIERADFLGGFWRNLFVDGLIVVGWIALWDPINSLLLPEFPYHREVAAYRQLRDAEVIVRPAAP